MLPSGIAPPNAAELLQTKAMAQLLDRVRAEYDIVIIDSPPLLPVTDAALLAARADGTLIVVRHGKTRRDQLAAAVERLAQVDVDAGRHRAQRRPVGQAPVRPRRRLRRLRRATAPTRATPSRGAPGASSRSAARGSAASSDGSRGAPRGGVLRGGHRERARPVRQGDARARAPPDPPLPARRRPRRRRRAAAVRLRGRPGPGRAARAALGAAPGARAAARTSSTATRASAALFARLAPRPSRCGPPPLVVHTPHCYATERQDVSGPARLALPASSSGCWAPGPTSSPAAPSARSSWPPSCAPRARRQWVVNVTDVEPVPARVAGTGPWSRPSAGSRRSATRCSSSRR